MTDDTGELEVTVESDGAAVRVVVSGELDIASAPLLAPHVQAEPSDRSVELDLRGVTFIDSSGLRLLIDAHRSLGDRLRIVPSPACERLFEIAGVRDRLPVVET
jgi:anti-anti-sigma factor